MRDACLVQFSKGDKGDTKFSRGSDEDKRMCCIVPIPVL